MKIARWFAILLNLVIATALASIPHLFYMGTTLLDGTKPQVPFLVTYKFWFYVAGTFVAGMSLIFWRPHRRLILLPILIYSFLTVFLAVSQASAFRHGWGEGLILYSVTVLPPLTLFVFSLSQSRASRAAKVNG